MDDDEDSDKESLETLFGEAIIEIAEGIDNEEEPREVVYELCRDASEPVYEALLDEMDERLEAWRSEMRGFEDRLYEDWQDPIDLLEALIVYSRDVGLEVNQDIRQQAVEENDLVVVALQKLHVRGVQIAQEILTLIKHGFADGAHARWRAIHEIATVAMFIHLSGQETAKRFLLHSIIDDYHLAKAVRKYPSTQGFGRISDDEMNALEKEREQLLNAFGQEYDRLWGWAAYELDIDRPRLKDIEKAAGLEHHRPYHKFASKLNIHAGSKGTMTQLGMMNDRAYTTASGPTNYGFYLPGVHTAVSLQQISTALLAHLATFESMLDMAVINRFLDDIQEAFPAVEEEIEQREREMWDEFIEEELEDNLDEFLEEYGPSPPPTVEIKLDEDDSED